MESLATYAGLFGTLTPDQAFLVCLIALLEIMGVNLLFRFLWKVC